LVNEKNLLEAVVVPVGLCWPQDLEHESLNVVSIQLVVVVNWVVNNAVLLSSVVVLFIVWICCKAPGLIEFVGDCLFDPSIASMDRCMHSRLREM